VRRAIFALLLGLTLAAACSYGAEQTGPSRPRVALEGPVDGRTLYERDCAWCHASDGSGTSHSPEIASDGAAAADFMLTTGRMPLVEPDDRMQRREPAYTDEEIDAIVSYVAGLDGGPQIPSVDPGEGDLAIGAELYSLNCAACHSTTGIGGALTSGQDAPSLHLATPTQTAEAMLTGPGAMPVFGPETLDRNEVDSVVAYVTYLQDPEDRGGSDLGGLGPWSEGLVAWVVGMGAVLVVVRVIGERARR
jgi:ubiquinol-cytochrome c reductase cytochrome c subunit